MPAILCIHLPQWPIDRRQRRDPRLRDVPLALVETIGTRQSVVLACPRIQKKGVRAGMTLAQARAICPNLTHLPHEPQRDLRALEALGRWLMRFSPVVALDPPGGIFLDVGGCERLFGGFERLLNQVRAALRKWNLHFRIAIAPTPGAAWAIARAGENGAIVGESELGDVLSPLPAWALRIDADTWAMLAHLGIETIGQLVELPRQTLPSRFGSQLLLRIDQAFGRVAEPLVPLVHACLIEASTEFDAAIDSLEMIQWVLRQLLRQLIPQLARRGLGVRRMEVTFVNFPTDPSFITKIIPLSRPTRNEKNLFDLLCCALETVKTEEGFRAVRLSIPLTQRIADEQVCLLDTEKHDSEQELAQLAERLRIRLGEEQIVQPRLVESHLPERAFQWTSEAKHIVVKKSPEKIAALWPERQKLQIPLSRPRPLHLLQTPVEVRVMVSPSDDREGRPIFFTHRGQVRPVTHATGPERIAGCWWDGHNKTRDYFDAEDPTGRRFWIFRVTQTSKWYLHGEW